MPLSRIYKDTPRSLLIFYVLVIYVIFQFCWWYYLLFDLNNQIFDLKQSLSGMIQNDPGTSALLQKKLSQKQWMIFGEGFVFMLLLFLGILQTRKSFRRETNVAKQQKNFLLSVTHELKSPIASVKLYLQTLEKRELDREKQRELLQKAIIETNRLDQLVENILFTTRIENQASTIQLEPIDLSALIENFVTNFEEKTGIPIQGNRQSNVEIKGDELALHSILSNLTENAVKYSNSAPIISIDLFQAASEIVLKVSDQGIGISDEDKERVFDKFFRAGNEETRQTKGTGLGLFIVRYLVNQHQASINIYRNSPKGSIFELRFNPINS